MGKQKVIAIFDIGKTNKKLLLFDENLKIIGQKESSFAECYDNEGFECDDIQKIETWLKQNLSALVKENKYDIKAINFSTYGASLVFLDNKDQRLTPLYNYLKSIPEDIQNSLFQKYGGKDEFCRKTASPPFGLLLNSGIQILWLKKHYPEIYRKTATILHFPQYLSFLLNGRKASESTSIGCHTFLWDHDIQDYHKWTIEEKLPFPKMTDNATTFGINYENTFLETGIGIHDSSAALLPYLYSVKENFILVSTGTWFVNMNPFNHDPLTKEQLQNNCLHYLSTNQKAVKASQLFLGRIHDENVKYISSFFSSDENAYKNIEADKALLKKYLNKTDAPPVFFKKGIPPDYIDKEVDLSVFMDFSEAYHCFMFDITRLNLRSIKMIMSDNNNIKQIYVSGGFSRSMLFMSLMATFFKDMDVFSTEVDNASAMGAALVVMKSLKKETPSINLNTFKWKPL